MVVHENEVAVEESQLSGQYLGIGSGSRLRNERHSEASIPGHEHAKA